MKMEGLAALLIVAAGTGAGLAQGAAGGGREIQGSYEQPLDRPGAAAQSQFTMKIMSSDETGEYEVTVENGSISAKVNGKEVPADRIERRGDVVIIKDEAGKTLKTFNVAFGPGRAAGRAGGRRGPGGLMVTPIPPRGVEPPIAPEPPEAPEPMFAMPMGEPPAVMIGIRMSDADGEKLGDLDVDHAIVIDDVIEGLPASKAGLHADDLVVEIDGTRPATQERLREILRGKEPGDKVVLTVVRDGKPEEVKVRLEAYDPGMLGAEVAPVPDFGGEGFALGLGDGNAWREQGEAARKGLEEALRALKDHQGPAMEEARRAIEEAMRTMDRHREEMAGRGGPFGAAPRAFVWGDRPGQVFQVDPDTQGRTLEKSLDRLTEQLDRLSERLDALEKRLEKKDN